MTSLVELPSSHQTRLMVKSLRIDFGLASRVRFACLGPTRGNSKFFMWSLIFLIILSHMRSLNSLEILSPSSEVLCSLVEETTSHSGDALTHLNETYFKPSNNTHD